MVDSWGILTEWIPELLIACTLAATIVIAVAAWRSASAAARSADATFKATEAQIVLRFLEEYASPDMYKSLYRLRIYKEEAQADFVERFRKMYDSNQGGAFPLNVHRRKVIHYFNNAYRLHKGGLLSKESLCLVTGVDGHRLLYEIVEPLSREIALSGPDDPRHEWFNELRELCPPPDGD